MKKSHIIILVLFIVIGATSLICVFNKDRIDKKDKKKYGDTKPIKQEIVLYHEYSNYAWGETHSCYFVDNKGNVYEYDYSYNDENFIDSLAKYASNHEPVRTLDDITDLEYYANMFNKFSNMDTEKVEQTMFDYGTHTLNCVYLKDNEFNKVTIAYYGDYSGCIPNEEVIDFVDLIQEDYGLFYINGNVFRLKNGKLIMEYR